MSTRTVADSADGQGTVARAGRLHVIFGVVFGIAMTIANTIAVGAYALLDANAIAELTAMVRPSGGYTVYVRRALGPFPGFVVGWSDWLSTCSSLAAVTIVIGEYTGVVFRSLAGSQSLIASAVVLLFVVVLARGARTAGDVHVATTVVKAMAFAAFIVACFALARPGSASPPAPASIPAGGALLVAFILAMQSVIFTCDGYAGVSYFAGEIRDPGRDIARSMFGGTATIIVIYLLVNIALLRVLSIGRLAEEAFPAGAAAAALFGPRGDTVLRVLVVASLFSSASAMLLIASRIIYGTSAGDMFPHGPRVSDNGTATLALPVSALTAIGFILSGTFEQVLWVFVLRRTKPNAPRPVRVVAHSWTTAIVFRRCPRPGVVSPG